MNKTFFACEVDGFAPVRLANLKSPLCKWTKLALDGFSPSDIHLMIQADSAPRDMAPLTASLLDPQEVLSLSRHLTSAYRLHEPEKMTVGDLSWSSAQKKLRNEEMRQRKVNQDGCLTVGDLSFKRTGPMNWNGNGSSAPPVDGSSGIREEE